MPKRIFALIGLTLVCFLALYTWDARTGKLSTLSAQGGLEVAGHVLAPGVWLKDRAADLWRDYAALSDVSRENARLREELGFYRNEALKLDADMRELERLRDLVKLPSTGSWGQTAARVVAGKFGPQAALNSLIINKGFADGAAPGSPVVGRRGLVGRVHHAAYSSSNVLLLNDPVFRVAVIGQESRVRGVLAGTGARQEMELLYVAPNSNMKVGELLVCSGLDGQAPKGVPAARVTSVGYDRDLLFLKVTAVPVADLEVLEEVMLLIPPKGLRAQDLFYLPYPAEAAPDETGQIVSDEEAARSMGGGQEQRPGN